MDVYPLIELAHMFYRVRSTIVSGERRLVEAPWKFSPLYPTRERGFRDLIQCLAHNIISYAFARWALVFSLVVALFIAGERFIQLASSSSLEETSELEGDRFRCA